MLEDSISDLYQAQAAAQVKSLCACSLLVFLQFTSAVCSILVLLGEVCLETLSI